MEKVQLSLERFLPELRDLERKNVFSKDEIADIVAQRRRFEIALASRAVKPIDYLRYVDYETKLEKLRKKRASRTKATTKKTLSDHSIAAHITHLHRLSTRRFPSSLQLWDAFLAHALAQASPHLVSRTLSTAIAMHPTHVPYWLMASRWESEGDERGLGGGNDEAARRLCMRALRFLKGSGEAEHLVWNEWIRVECAFAERLRARWALLGIGKGGSKGEEEIIIAGEKSKKRKTNDGEGMDVDGAENEDEDEDGPEGVDLSILDDQAQVEDDEGLKEEVQKEAASGQEAIIEGAIVRVVLDNYLASFKHSIDAYERLLLVLRPLPSPNRLSLLKHVYASLSAQFAPSSPSYARALHILATRHFYDVTYNPKRAKKGLDADGKTIQVKGEKLVDAVGAGVDQYWNACKGKKGKGKEKAPLPVWESFCSWLEEMAEEIEEENLRVYLSTNLTTALSLAPSSPFLSLLHLRHLLRTSAPLSELLSFAGELTKRFGSADSPAPTREQVWVARVETVVALSSGESSSSPSNDDVEAVFERATKAIPFSGRLWAIHADWVEQSSSTSSDVIGWYEQAVARVLVADAVPPVGFESTFTDAEDEEAALEPRGLIPRRYVRYLVETEPASIASRVEKLISSAPTLSIDVLTTILDLPSSSSEHRRIDPFRISLFERIIKHPNAGPLEWVRYAEELLRAGEAGKSTEVVQRGRRTFKGPELVKFEKRWTEVCDA